jgi:hypothetical protein
MTTFSLALHSLFNHPCPFLLYPLVIIRHFQLIRLFTIRAHLLRLSHSLSLSRSLPLSCKHSFTKDELCGLNCYSFKVCLQLKAKEFCFENNHFSVGSCAFWPVYSPSLSVATFRIKLEESVVDFLELFGRSFQWSNCAPFKRLVCHLTFEALRFVT